jgi:hypothetical protein
MKGKCKISAVCAVVLWTAVSAAMVGSEETAADKPLAAGTIVSRNIAAAGGRENLERVKAIRFQVGTQIFTAAAARLKVQSAIEPPAVFETLLADGAGVRRNTLGRTVPVTGIEAGRWLLLARLFGGCFTLDRFAGALNYDGMKAFGPERFHVLSHDAAGLRVTFHVDAADFLLKRLVMSGRGAAGLACEESAEFAAFSRQESIMLPTVLFFSQLGVSGTNSQRPQTLDAVRFNPELAAGFFQSLEINAGTPSAAAGRLDGNVLGAYFDDEDFFVQIFSNWTIDEVEAAGFKNNDLLVLSSNGVEFESRLFISSDQVNDPTVYAPGNSLFTRAPSRRPLFYAQFNTCSPREKFVALKAGIKVLAPLQARKK